MEQLKLKNPTDQRAGKFDFTFAFKDDKLESIREKSSEIYCYTKETNIRPVRISDEDITNACKRITGNSSLIDELKVFKGQFDNLNYDDCYFISVIIIIRKNLIDCLYHL